MQVADGRRTDNYSGIAAQTFTDQVFMQRGRGEGGINIHPLIAEAFRIVKDEQDSSKWPDMESSIKTKSTVANVFFGIAGAAAVTAVILYFVEGGSEREAPSSGTRTSRNWTLTAGPTAVGEGGQVGFGMQF